MKSMLREKERRSAELKIVQQAKRAREERGVWLERKELRREGGRILGFLQKMKLFQGHWEGACWLKTCHIKKFMAPHGKIKRNKEGQ